MVSCPPGPLTRQQTADLVESIRKLLAAIDADEVSASTATRYRLEGALGALEEVLGERSASLNTPG
jgi:hypothetical protein